MQPFDGGVFDKRYEDVFAIAIAEAGLEAYRVDQDPQVAIPIEDIENGIRDARICLADITLDNPNVWFELGFAYSAGKNVVLVCSNERTTKFPFDVQHRSIIKYTSEAPRDFEELKKSITNKLKAFLHREESLPKVSEMARLVQIDGLSQHEIVAIASVAENLEHPHDYATTYQIKRDMDRSGFTKIATTIALRALIDKEFLVYEKFTDENGDPYSAYYFTPKGWAWVVNNQDRFLMRKP
ncbi:hypothetical protein [Nevskia ramosa]|uniref:hypothetical protein n=1 Tax=Nevskia ramosa TaxID=64002 RepID=UPI001B7FCA18|nr:hypothetical protein [Nevskia ramosa]